MPHILLIEDNSGDVRLISEMLREAETVAAPVYRLTHFERVTPAVGYLRDHDDVDIILSDISLPDSHGEQTFNLLAEAAAELPVVFMTGSADEGFAIQAIHSGAQDYLLKGRITSETLEKTITYAIERQKTQKEMNRITATAREGQARIKLLAQQKRQLQALNKAKDEFISLASHQLRTPATAVKQYIGMIIEGYVGDVDQKQLPLLRTAYESNERQLTIINELLKTAQLDSNRYHLNFQRHELTALLHEVLADEAPTLALSGQQVDFQPDQPYYARVDTTELKLVLANLIENACKYTPPGKVLTVSAGKSGRRNFISISDQGVGIAPDDQQRIFDKFTRVDNEMSDTVAGSGLGLYWVRKIMRLHKGSIEVASQPGQGSTFTVWLPQ